MAIFRLKLGVSFLSFRITRNTASTCPAGIPFFETSARSGENVDRAFLTLASNILKQRSFSGAPRLWTEKHLFHPTHHLTEDVVFREEEKSENVFDMIRKVELRSRSRNKSSLSVVNSSSAGVRKVKSKKSSDVSSIRICC